MPSVTPYGANLQPLPLLVQSVYSVHLEYAVQSLSSFSLGAPKRLKAFKNIQ